MSVIYLGVDVGTTSTKCQAVDEDGRVLAFAQQPYPMTHPHQDWAEQDPMDYWRALVSVVSRCVRQCQDLGRAASDIDALSMSTQGNTLIVTDGAGDPLMPAISWMDRRPTDQCARLSSEIGGSAWHAATGSRLIPNSPACKILWLREHRPELWERTERVACVPDYLAFRLCGEFAVDVPSASWTPFYSSLDRDWSRMVLDVTGVRDDMLPRTVESGSTIGHLTREVAGEMGLSEEVRLVAGAFDQAAAAYGAGASAGELGVLSCGTAWVFYTVARSVERGGFGEIPICCHTVPGEWGMVMPFAGGSVYDWLNSRLAPFEQGSESGAPLPVFVPHLYGGLAPDFADVSKGSLIGLTMSHTPRDIQLALMRGVACEARRNLEVAERGGGPVKRIRMVGGAAKGEDWPRIVANVLNRTVEVSDVADSACWGAARIAAGLPETWPEQGRVTLIEPDAERVEAEEHSYRRYRGAYELLLGMYEADARGDV